MSPTTLAPDKLEVGFLEAEAALRGVRTKVALWLGVLLMPAGFVLDWAMYPQQFGVLLCIRLATTLLLGLGLVGAVQRKLDRFIFAASVELLLLPSLAISGIIYVTDGGRSNYFFGLILLMVFIQLLGLHLREAITYCSLTIAAYYLAVVANHGIHTIAVPRLAFTSFFLLTTALVSVVICHLNLRNRHTDFTLRLMLDEQNRQLEKLAKQRMNFLADVSHELRTPLSMILAPLDELLEHRGRVPEGVGQSLALVRRNAERLRILVDDLLDMSRIDSGKMRLRLEPIDVWEFATQTLELVRVLADQAQIKLAIAGDSSPLEILIDRERLERALVNLLSNAIRYSPPRETVQLRIASAASAVEIQCIDHGPGIPDAMKSQIFERDFQVLSGGLKQSQGLGLGLAIASEIVRWHGGSMSVEDARSEDPPGSRFTIRMLRAQELEALEQPPATDVRPLAERFKLSASDTPPATWDLVADPQTTEREVAAAGAGAETVEVLVIDDEHDLREFLQLALSDTYTTLSAATGERGIALALQYRPQCILLDMMLPDRDGMDVLTTLRAQTSMRDTKIIMITAHPDEAIKIRALHNGADEFLPKPFSATELRARVASLVRSSRLQQDLRAEQASLRDSLEKLRQTESRLFHSEKMRAVASLAAGLLHEINNPVNFTLMAVKTLRRDLERKRDDIAEVIDDIQSGIQRISDIITDLRGFAYPQQAEAQGQFALRRAVVTALRFARHELMDAEVTVAEDSFEDFQVLGNQSQVTQVLLNLVLNGLSAAQRHGDQRTPKIAIEVSPADERVRVTVRDNGVGISPDNLNRITEPFWTTAHQGQGLGLGMSVCDTIVRAHGGQLQIESEEMVGTAVSFDLPLAL